jgi:hypothetical protein
MDGRVALRLPYHDEVVAAILLMTKPRAGSHSKQHVASTSSTNA